MISGNPECIGRRHRSHVGFAAPQSLYGGKGLTPDTLDLVTILMIPLEALLIIIAMIGFAQGWNVEMEVPEDEAKKKGLKPAYRGPETSAA